MVTDCAIMGMSHIAGGRVKQIHRAPTNSADGNSNFLSVLHFLQGTPILAPEFGFCTLSHAVSLRRRPTAPFAPSSPLNEINTLTGRAGCDRIAARRRGR